MNLLAITTENKKAVNQVYNTAVGDKTTLVQLTDLMKKYLSEYDEKIGHTDIKHGPKRVGNIPHSLASIEKAENLLGYNPKFKIEEGLKDAVNWYWENLKPILSEISR